MAGLLGKPPRPRAPDLPKDANGKRHPDGVKTFGERRADDLDPEEKAHGELLKRLEEDITLRGRPALRWVRRYLATTSLKNMDGSPVKNKAGEELKLTLEEIIIHAGVTGAITPGPDQHKYWRDMATLLVGPAIVQPATLEAARPGDGPGSSGGAPADDGRIPTPDEIRADAQELVRLNQIALDVIKDAHGERELTAIDVKAELVRELEGKKDEVV
jgi:hypothetical protein